MTTERVTYYVCGVREYGPHHIVKTTSKDLFRPFPIVTLCGRTSRFGYVQIYDIQDWANSAEKCGCQRCHSKLRKLLKGKTR